MLSFFVCFCDSTFHFIIPLFIALFLSLSHHGVRQSQIIISHHTMRDTNETRARSLNSRSLIVYYMFLSPLDFCQHWFLVQSGLCSACHTATGWILTTQSRAPAGATNHLQNGITVQLAANLQSSPVKHKAATVFMKPVKPFIPRLFFALWCRIGLQTRWKITVF